MSQQIYIPQILLKFNSYFINAGYKAYLVGGAVRDVLLNKEATDWDVATNAPPDQVASLFKHVIPTGIAHGTVTVLFAGIHIEVTTFRTESNYSDGRHPDSVKYTATIEEDLSRRDFTMNAIAADLSDGLLIDPFGGIADIKAGIIRTVGAPAERFSEDGLRPIRAIRFSSQLGFSIESKTLEAIPNSLARTFGISIERFRDEFIKILSSDLPSKGLKLLESTGILSHFIPELISCRNIIQADFRGHHQFDVLDHLYYSCDGAPKKKPNVRLAALFHDIGKPTAKKTAFQLDGNGKNCEIYTFYGHELVSEKITNRILSRLRFPTKTIENCCHLIKEHMFHYESTWTDGAVRRFLVRISPLELNDLLDLRLADVYGMTCVKIELSECGLPNGSLLELENRIKKLESQQAVLSLKNLAINGNDLINSGIPKGKEIGIILNALLNIVLDNPTQNNRNYLLETAKRIYLQNKQ